MILKPVALMLAKAILCSSLHPAAGSHLNSQSIKGAATVLCAMAFIEVPRASGTPQPKEACVEVAAVENPIVAVPLDIVVSVVEAPPDMAKMKSG